MTSYSFQRLFELYELLWFSTSKMRYPRLVGDISTRGRQQILVSHVITPAWAATKSSPLAHFHHSWWPCNGYPAVSASSACICPNLIVQCIVSPLSDLLLAASLQPSMPSNLASQAQHVLYRKHASTCPAESIPCLYRLLTSYTTLADPPAHQQAYRLHARVHLMGQLALSSLQAWVQYDL